MMLKGSFSSLPSYKYGRFKPNFFCGTNDDEEDAACLETYFQQFVDDFRFDSASRITALAYTGLAPRLDKFGPDRC